MIGNKYLVLRDIEHCNKVHPIMQKLGIKPDGWWRSIDNGETWFFTSREDQDPSKLSYDLVINIPTYRQDKLALALPDWAMGSLDTQDYSGLHDKFIKQKLDGPRLEKIYELALSAVLNKNHHKLEATADLLILLDSEGLPS